MTKPYILGIAGGSGSGKTTLAQNILTTLGTHQTGLISHDAYYKDLSHLSPQMRAQTNFDHPNAIETELLIAQLKKLTLGQTIKVPIYDFTTHARTSKSITINPSPIILIEGILLFTHPQLCDLLNLKIFVDAPPDIRFIRRLNRDITERGRTPKSVTDQYLSTVRPMHDAFVEPSRKYADLIIPGETHTHLATHFILSHLQTIRTST